MKKFTFIFSLLLAAFTTYGQKTKTLTQSGPTLSQIKVFDVIADKPYIKHGSYTTQHKESGDIYIKGYYKNDLKDSLWTETGYNKLPVYSGSYKNGEKIGLWNYYDNKGNLESTYNYTTKELTYQNKKKPDTANYTIIKNGEKVITKLERSPVIIPGWNFLYRELGSILRYPSTAVENDINGKVIIGFTVDETGKVKDHYISQKVHPLLDEEALRSVKELTTEWLPGLLNGKPVATMVYLPVVFQTSKKVIVK